MTNAQERTSDVPDGIAEEHIRSPGGWRRHASPLSLAIFGVVIIAGLAGLLGHERDWVAESGGRTLTVHAPEVIRNGEFFEIRITVESEEPIDELAIGVDASLWEDMTVNTMIPAATEEVAEAGEFLFTFGPLEAGTTFDLKVDLQVNPDIVGGNDGAVTLYDGEESLQAVDVSIAVLP
jgi:hypothetical protein